MALAIKIFPQKEALFFPIIYFIVFVSVIIHGIMVPIVHLTLIGIRIRTASIEEERGAPEWPENVPFSRTMISNPIIDGNTGLPVPAPMAMIREASHEGVARIDRGESELNMIVTSQDALLGSN
jgi:NhaP-type Na+/H+ or K+/H+ antiporter